MANNRQTHLKRTRKLERKQAKRRRDSVAGRVASRHKRNINKKSRRKKLAIKIVVATFLLFAIGVGSLFAFAARYLPSADGILQRAIPESTKIYANDGKTILFEIFKDQKRTRIPLEEIPKNVVNATIAIEDNDFYSHHGVDFRGIARSIINNLTSSTTQGGSTITQQLVKNAVLTSERTYWRKIQEVILAIEMESKFSKDQIMELYLNEIPYGNVAYGIEAAAQNYFDKDAKDLTLAESALLASLPQSPSYLWANKDKLLTRKDFTLDRMAQLGMIDEDEVKQANKEELKFAKRDIQITAPHFVFEVKKYLVEKYGEKLVEQGGLKVTTTLNKEIQQEAERAIKEGAARNKQNYGVNNAALVAMDPRNGKILALVGSKDYFDDSIDGSVDVPFTMQQMGSSVKPYVVANALAHGYPPTTMIFDVQTDFGGNYKPKNYSGGFSGPINMRNAIQHSLNIPMVKFLYLGGKDNMLDMMRKLGVHGLADNDQYGLAVALGAAEMRLVDHVAAFGVFANDGRKMPMTTVAKVEDPTSKVLEEWKEQKGEQAVDQNVARTLSNILSDDAARAPVFGAGSYLTLADRPVAAKTGTTNDNKDGATIGYVPQLVAGVWVGNNDNTPFRGGDGFKVAAPIWNDFMSHVLAGKKVIQFNKPEPMPANKAVLAGKIGAKGGEKKRISKIDGKLAPKDLPDNYVEEKEFNDYHTILFFLDRNNPLGPAPGNPKGDPMFTRWEKAVLAWAKNKKGAAPKETSPYGAAEVKPRISILQPASNAVIGGDSVTAISSVDALAGTKSVEYKLDGKVVGAAPSEPFALKITLGVPNGVHTITATATDKYGGKGTTSIDIQVKKDTVAPVANFVIAPHTTLDVAVDGTSSTDNEGIVSYLWDFGDSTTQSGDTATHTFASGNTYTISLTVTDAAGLSNTKTQDVTVP